MATVHLVDASPYIFRAYFALPDSLVAPDGQPTNAIHGFFGFLVGMVWFVLFFLIFFFYFSLLSPSPKSLSIFI